MVYKLNELLKIITVNGIPAITGFPTDKNWLGNPCSLMLFPLKLSYLRYKPFTIFYIPEYYHNFK